MAGIESYSNALGALSTRNYTIHDKDDIDGDVINKGIGDAGSTADLRMLWFAKVCLGLGLL